MSLVSGQWSVAKRIKGIGLDDFELRIADFGFRKAPMSLPPQESLLPFETMSQFTEPVIPESVAGGYPESSKSSMTPLAVWFPAFAGTLSGSRLASRFAGLGRDDELRPSL